MENKIENYNDRCYTVYMHISPSEKRYIGITKRSTEKRWCNGTGLEDKRKSIVQYSIDGEFIRLWGSTNAITKELGFDNSAIIRCCKGNQKSSYGFIWRYASDITDPTVPLFPTTSTSTTLSETA